MSVLQWAGLDSASDNGRTVFSEVMICVKTKLVIVATITTIYPYCLTAAVFFYTLLAKNSAQWCHMQSRSGRIDPDINNIDTSVCIGIGSVLTGWERYFSFSFFSPCISHQLGPVSSRNSESLQTPLTAALRAAFRETHVLLTTDEHSLELLYNKKILLPPTSKYISCF